MCLHSSSTDVDYTDTVNKYFGRKGWITGMVIFIINLIVPIIIYIQLLAQTLYPNLFAIAHAIDPKTYDKFVPKKEKDLDFTHLSYTWTCFIVFVGVFLVTMRKDLEIFIKLNFFGAWMIFVVIIFVLGYGILAFTNTNYAFVMGKATQDFTTDTRNISLFNVDFAPLMGMLGGGYYLHNISIPIARTAKNQETATRDVMYGYFFCCISYLICGTIGLFGFYGTFFNDYYANNKTDLVA